MFRTNDPAGFNARLELAWLREEPIYEVADVDPAVRGPTIVPVRRGGGYQVDGFVVELPQTVFAVTQENLIQILLMFVTSQISVIVACVVLVVVPFTIIGSFSSPVSTGTILSRLLIPILVSMAMLALLNFLTYFFASRSLKNTFHALARIREKILLQRARTYVLIGGAIPFVGGALVAFGMYKFQQVYDTWLANPPAMPSLVLS